MLLFICSRSEQSLEIIDISIHLMLLFIHLLQSRRILSRNFNTSHVTVYPLSSKFLYFIYRISIHLMLLFIPLVPNFSISSTAFQYISCYCLSCVRLNIVKINSIFQYISCYCLSRCFQHQHIVSRHFNTSHVTVYLDSIYSKAIEI